jgi:hypothetical protein
VTDLREVLTSALPRDGATVELLLATLRPLFTQAQEAAYQDGWQDGRAHAPSCRQEINEGVY